MPVVGKCEDCRFDGSQESGECLVGTERKTSLSIGHTPHIFADEIHHRRIIGNTPQDIYT